MLVLCYGVTKTGSTLAFELAKKALSNAGFEQPHLPETVVEPGHKVNFVNDLTPDRIDRMCSLIGPNGKIAIKTHTGLDRRTFMHVDRLSAEGKVRVQVVYRDPRDTCLSMIDAGEKARANDQKAFAEIETLRDAVNAVKRQMQKLRRWGAVQDALILSYDEVAFDTDNALKTIDAHLGITSNHTRVIDEVMNRTFTQKNKAKQARYKSELDKESIEALNAEFAPFLRRICKRKDYTWFTLARERILAQPEKSDA